MIKNKLEVFVKKLSENESINQAERKADYWVFGGIYVNGDLSFMLGIPAIGTKFKDAEELGPQSGKYHYTKRRVKGNALQIELTFDFH
jgi:hypothetical protein